MREREQKKRDGLIGMCKKGKGDCHNHNDNIIQ